MTSFAGFFRVLIVANARDKVTGKESPLTLKINVINVEQKSLRTPGGPVVNVDRDRLRVDRDDCACTSRGAL